MNIGKNKLKAFTLVELIIVIIILVILATIAYLTLRDYPGNARDAERKADLSNIAKTLELYQIEKGEFPQPDGTTTTSEGWTEGVFGSRVYGKTQRLSELPTDPLDSNKKYTYIVSDDKKSFRLSAEMENGQEFVVAGGRNKNVANSVTLGPPLPPLRPCEAEGGLSFTFQTGTKGPTGVVKDNNTLLMWESEGTSAGSSERSNGETTTTMNWNAAKFKCANLTKGGFTDWRLPDITELRSIVNYNCYNGAVNTAYFSLNSYRYWSSTTEAGSTDRAWTLNFEDGRDRTTNKSDTSNVLCVR